MCIIVLNFFQNTALLIANCYDQDFIESQYYWAFHFLDFGQGFVFAISEAVILIQCGFITGLLNLIIVTLSIGGTTVPLILFLLNAEVWEIPAHWLEYSAQYFVTLTSFAFIFGNQDKKGVLYKYRYYEAALIVISLSMSILKLFIYGEVIEIEMGGERAAHFFEYTGEMFNDVFALVFTIIRF